MGDAAWTWNLAGGRERIWLGTPEPPGIPTKFVYRPPPAWFDRFFGLSLGLDAGHDHRPGPGAPPGAAPVRLGGRVRPQRRPDRRPQAGPEPPGLLRAFSDDVAALCSRRRPSGCSSSRATCRAWSARTRRVPGRYHCTAPPSRRRPARCPPITDPSWRRCASGSPTPRSSFDLAGKERELAGLREQAAAPNLWDDPERARRVMSRLAAVEGDLQTVARLQRQLEDLET